METRGKGNQLAASKLGEVSTKTLIELYNDKEHFAVSLWLDEMAAAGIGVR